jgi:hypothetical protein
MRGPHLSFLLLLLSTGFGSTSSLFRRQSTCGEYEIPCGSACCGELTQSCINPSQSLCCSGYNAVEIDGICCTAGGTVTNGLCCPKGQNNCGGACCPGDCVVFNPPRPIIGKLPLEKRWDLCLATQAGCLTIQNASGKTCGQASDCGSGWWDCVTGCCIQTSKPPPKD